MKKYTRFTAAVLILLIPAILSAAEPVNTVDALVKAVAGARDGDTVTIAAGTFKLKTPLEPGAGVTITGAGIDKTIITNDESWKPSTKTLPDPEMKTKGMDTRAYLFRLQDKAAGITISNMTLRGAGMHGAIYGWSNAKLILHHLKLDNFLWASIRTFSMREGRIHDCEFINAGGRWKRMGIPGDKGGITGGAIFAIWMKDFEIFNNRFTRTQTEKRNEFYGIKVRQGKRCRIHHNTIEVNFSIEMPFENDEDVEIDHNVCTGTISIPKHAGGPVPKSGRTFRVHHNYMRDTYSIEFSRNGIEIDHNLFDFDTQKDHGNLISGFGHASSPGPAVFHNNMISNPGRGVIWINDPYSNLEVRNNHVITRTTKTPRRDGLFGFNKKCNFKTILIRDNIFECEGQSRPVFRNEESYGARVENNSFKNIQDAKRFENRQTGKKQGLEKPLEFTCGVNGEYTIKGWKADKTVNK